MCTVKSNIIFLDIDGVLNTWRFQDYQVKHHECDDWDAQFNFDPICMKNLKELVEKTNSKIVVSSSWKKSDNGMKDIELNLRLYGLAKVLLGHTIRHPKDLRCFEISEWWYRNKDKYNQFIILDDEKHMRCLSGRLIVCDENNGFTKETLSEALNKLGV